MHGGTQYWRPGEARPQASQGETATRDRGSGDGLDNNSRKGKKRGRQQQNKQGEASSSDRNRGAHGGKSGSKGRQSGLGTGDQRDGGRGRVGIGAGPSSGGKTTSGPSQGLLAMKFMQRKAKADENVRQRDQKRKKLEDEFSSSFTKRFKANAGGEKDRLVCRPDEQDPAFIYLGRRSFGGFNIVAETAYDACVRDIAAGASIREVDDDENGISDMEMAKRLGNSIGRGRR